MAEHKKSQNSLFPDIEMNNVMGGQNGHNMSVRKSTYELVNAYLRLA